MMARPQNALAEATSLLSTLVAIDSVNPSLVAGGAGEHKIAAFIVGWAAEHHLETEAVPGPSGRPSVLVRTPGTRPQRTIMFNAHTDTVGVTGMKNAHDPIVDGDRLYGRGAYDMKGGLASALLAAADLAAEGIAGVIVAAVADEEFGSEGTETVLQHVIPDAAIVVEPTDLEIAIAHKGFLWAEIKTHGTAAHGSRRDLGRDAIVCMAPVLTALRDLEVRLREQSGHDLLGSGSIHASVIAGGREQSTYPAECVLRLERRTIPGETLPLVETELTALTADADGATSRVMLWRSPFGIDAQAPLVRLAERALKAERLPAVRRAEHPWTDAALLSDAGVPTLVLGPGGAGAHADVEWVLLPDVERCRRALRRVARAFLTGEDR